jgi:hypothetical protein
MNEHPDSLTPAQSLQQGLLLERRGMLLPWGASREELVKICQPARIEHRPFRDTLFWEQPVVLGGMVGDELEINLAPRGGFYLAWIWLEHGEIRARSEEAFREAIAHLKKIFGEPAESLSPGTAQFNILITWWADEVSVGLELRQSLEEEGVRYACKLNIFCIT